QKLDPGNTGGTIHHEGFDLTFVPAWHSSGIFHEARSIYLGACYIVPIGDRFTMGAKTAALACKRFFKFEKVIPCHYGTFPIIDQTADKFVAEMDSNTVVVPKVGVPFEV